MEYFLERIAKLLYTGYGDRIHHHCLVFPNRRAGLFFTKYLAAQLSKPVWTPSIITINDLFHALSPLQPAENELLLFELFKVYRSLTKSSEKFDNFFFWGDILLNDFDDVDKYLVDASKLFRNVYDLKKIDEQFGGLTPEQAEAVKRFWIHFDPDSSTDKKTEFIKVWSVLSELYGRFRVIIREKNLAYEGMIFRDVIENQDWRAGAGAKWDIVHFIGFNALNECEKAIMSGLKKDGRARFYWDYDNIYVRSGKMNSAGFFMKDNLEIFGNDMPPDWSYDTMLSMNSSQIKRRVIDASSDVGQVKLIPDLIKSMPGLTPENAHQTAIVLADENMLMPVLTSLPENISDVNITMGYPLRHTSVYSLVKQLLEMLNNAEERDGDVYFYYGDVKRILTNSLVTNLMTEKDNEVIQEITEKNLILIPAARFEDRGKLSELFKKPSTTEQVAEYLRSVLLLIVSGNSDSQNKTSPDVFPGIIINEFIYRVILSINRLDAISHDPEIRFTTGTWTLILDSLLKKQSVPFSGEPLTGIQIMGILETRTLDFKNLVILSVNEGILPAITASSSFIPFSLREAFGLPSINHQESIYAYHFYRLLHRAENVTFVYNSNPEGMRSGEMSRFLQQMKYDNVQKPEFKSISYEIGNPAGVREIIERTEDHYLRIFSRYSDGTCKNRLSPSAINTWLSCRMRFYYRYVNGLKEPEQVIEEIDPALLGVLLHESMRKLYGSHIGRLLDKDHISAILGNSKEIKHLIIETIRDVFKRTDDYLVAANELIVRDVLLVYISRILEIDRRNAPFTILGLEEEVGFRVFCGETGILAGGTVDRIDISSGITRIVDYKTGSTADSIPSVSFLFKDGRDKNADGWLQTLLYCEGYLNKMTGARVRPAVYKIKRLPGDQPDDMLVIKASRGKEFLVEDYTIVRNEFLENLDSAVKAIFSKNEPFVMTSDIRNKCSWCPYRVLCMR
jgi:hypothetical protein